jgi:hypothetical protein
MLATLFIVEGEISRGRSSHGCESYIKAYYRNRRMPRVQQVRWSRSELSTRKFLNKGDDEFDGH